MRFGFSVMAAALLSSVRGFFGGAVASPFPDISAPAPHRHRSTSKRIRLGGRTYKPNGTREVARRQRQIIEGRLTASNGVVFHS
ncbi:hypothetical protein F9K94_15360 [Brucella tritici]|uniref:Secreted protein n=1 Tax=Brucella tritici TaxID=94626 RepID=A0A7V8B1I4_9HYPH|nr:hypothetical protein [Brucella tritici]KAB2655903.1 hypothetical protein F9K94_15360 [Brucella tritici]